MFFFKTNLFYSIKNNLFVLTIKINLKSTHNLVGTISSATRYSVKLLDIDYYLVKNRKIFKLIAFYYDYHLVYKLTVFKKCCIKTQIPINAF